MLVPGEADSECASVENATPPKGTELGRNSAAEVRRVSSPSPPKRSRRRPRADADGDEGPARMAIGRADGCLRGDEGAKGIGVDAVAIEKS